MNGNLGLCMPDMEHRRAKVWILDSLNTPTMKRTIIHELLHALLDPMSNMATDAAFEDGLRQLDRILHRADKRY
jgi:Zn-dependent peptidase ImmA (M78 family)